MYIGACTDGANWSGHMVCLKQDCYFNLCRWGILIMTHWFSKILFCVNQVILSLEFYTLDSNQVLLKYFNRIHLLSLLVLAAIYMSSWHLGDNIWQPWLWCCSGIIDDINEGELENSAINYHCLWKKWSLRLTFDVKQWCWQSVNCSLSMAPLLAARGQSPGSHINISDWLVMMLVTWPWCQCCHSFYLVVSLYNNSIESHSSKFHLVLL